MASSIIPNILYILLAALVILLMVFVYKMIITLDKANIVLDDIYRKVKKLDNLFEIIDKSTDTINLVTDKITALISSSILKIFKKRKGR